ncbi:calcium-dependent phosphotriesterase [Obba rivulosa]|uniref:Calcium-dependent phosphotriesterase n=1 Tax=Obba rivulosa TaxID=1052685 RepID=A0A8E2DL14_9APHY|nr:calcium-dependent phosphotriesterase [Obba rivulosa]
MACTDVSSRKRWLPNMRHLDKGGMVDGYLATYDPDTSKINHIDVVGKNFTRGFSLHGFDVVHSATNSSELFFYMINHQIPREGNAWKVGADSVIEILKGAVGSSTLRHVMTVEDPVIMTPNEIVGTSDGKSFWFTNDHGSKTGWIRELEMVYPVPSTSVGYCHVDHGCKVAADKLPSSNGLAWDRKTDTFYVGSTPRGTIGVFERQSDNTLAFKDAVTIGQVMDNLSVDSEGAVWAATFPKSLRVLKRFRDTVTNAPSAAFRVSFDNVTTSSGGKHEIERVLEDDGSIVGVATSVAHDPRRGLVFLHGLTSPRLAVCRI